MTVGRTMLVASAAALMSAPIWAIPSQASPGHGNGHPPHTTPAGPPHPSPTNADEHGHGKANGHSNGKAKGHSNGAAQPGTSHKCSPHQVAFIVSGRLVRQTLAKNSDGTYTGTVTLKVTQTNHHAATEKQGALEKPYSLTSVRVTFGLPDVNGDGAKGLDDLKEGDRAKLIGKVTKLAKKCNTGTFTPQTSIRKVLFNEAS
jgi:hypothetical protein